VLIKEVIMSNQTLSSVARPATSEDVRKVLGNLSDALIAEILTLKPFLTDLEDAAVCMAGDHDVLAKSGHHVPLTAARIVELLTDEEQEPER
jgi:hypothetical protein